MRAHGTRIVFSASTQRCQSAQLQGRRNVQPLVIVGRVPAHHARGSATAGRTVDGSAVVQHKPQLLVLLAEREPMEAAINNHLLDEQINLIVKREFWSGNGKTKQYRLFPIELQHGVQHSLLDVDQDVVVVVEGILLWVAHWAVVEKHTVLPLKVKMKKKTNKMPTLS